MFLGCLGLVLFLYFSLCVSVFCVVFIESMRDCYLNSCIRWWCYCGGHLDMWPGKTQSQTTNHKPVIPNHRAAKQYQSTGHLVPGCTERKNICKHAWCTNHVGAGRGSTAGDYKWKESMFETCNPPALNRHRRDLLFNQPPNSTQLNSGLTDKRITVRSVASILWFFGAFPYRREIFDLVVTLLKKWAICDILL